VLLASATTTKYPPATVTVREILDRINNLWNTEVTEAAAIEIVISIRTLTDQCNAKYLDNIQVDSIYTPTNAFPNEIKSWYFSDLNFTNIQKYIIETFENLERNSYSTQIETSNRCIDTLYVLVDYLNLVIFSRLGTRIKLRQKKLDDCNSSNSVETSNLVIGDDLNG
jgi:hypothetical protein